MADKKADEDVVGWVVIPDGGPPANIRGGQVSRVYATEEEAARACGRGHKVVPVPRTNSEDAE